MDNSIFDQNQKVYTSLAGYNIAYTNYISCVDNDISDCSVLSSQLDSSYNDLNSNISKLYSLLSNRKNDNTDVKDVYDVNNNLRNNLASQLQQLYEYKVSLSDESDINNGLPSIHNVDSSLYIGLVWTTVATICLYYIFVKL